MLCFYFLHTPGTDRVRDETKTWNCFFFRYFTEKIDHGNVKYSNYEGDYTDH